MEQLEKRVEAHSHATGVWGFGVRGLGGLEFRGLGFSLWG